MRSLYTNNEGFTRSPRRELIQQLWTRLFAILFVGSMLIGWLHAQEPVSSSTPKANSARADQTPLTPFVRPDPAAVDKERENLAQLVKRTEMWREVGAGIAKEARAAFDGTPGQAIAIHLLELYGLKDDAKLILLTTAGIERLKWQIQLDRREKGRLAKQESVAVDKSQKQAADLAKEVQALRTNGDPDDLLPARERELLGLIRLRKEQTDRFDDYTRQAKSYDDEVALLVKFDKQLDGMARSTKVEVQRRSQAIEHESSELVSVEVRADRQELRDMLASLKIRAEAVAKGGNATIPTSAIDPGSKVKPSLPFSPTKLPPLNPDERQLIEEELKTLAPQ